MATPFGFRGGNPNGVATVGAEAHGRLKANGSLSGPLTLLFPELNCFANAMAELVTEGGSCALGGRLFVQQQLQDRALPRRLDGLTPIEHRWRRASCQHRSIGQTGKTTTPFQKKLTSRIWLEFYFPLKKAQSKPFFLALIVLGLTGGMTITPSEAHWCDSGKNLTTVERAICSDQGLIQQDIELNRLYENWAIIKMPP